MDANNPQNNQHNPNNDQALQGPPTTPLEPAYIRRTYTSSAGHVPSAATPPQKRNKRQSALLGLMLSGMLVGGMLLGGAGAGAVMLVASNSSSASASSAGATQSGLATSTNSPQLVAQSNTITIGSIYNKVSPSVVKITTVVKSGNGRFSTSGEATGTGIILDTNGNILTNNHVIANATSLKVELSDGSQYNATVVGTAPQDDLAVIKTDAPGGALVPATLSDSSTVKVGDEVIAIGYPYGLGQSVTSGIVSGLNRSEASSSGSRSLNGLIQIDAAINPGNSGGPLLNTEGQVIGINTMLEGPVEGFTGVGLAIPINNAKALLDQLEKGSAVERPWLGISGVEITPGLQQEYSLSVSKGILVVDVTANSPAAQAGIQGSAIAGSTDQSGATAPTTTQIGDIIVAIDGQKAAAVSDLTSYLNSKQPGDKVTLSIVRNGQQQDVTLTLQAWPSGATISLN